jgi:MFS family permease
MSDAPATEPTPTEPPAHGLSLWRDPAFVRFWFASIGASFGFQMLAVAVGQQIYELTRNVNEQSPEGLESGAWHLGLIGLVQFFPTVLLALPAGHVADQFQRRRITLCTLSLQFAVISLLAALTLSGRIHEWSILVIVFTVSVAKTFEFPSMQSLLPSLVPRQILPQAFAMKASANQAAMVMGPALTGFLYILGPGVVYSTAAVLYVLAAAMMWGLPEQPLTHERERPTLDSLLAGFRFIWARADVLGVMSLDLFAVLLGGATALLPIFADKILHVGPTGLGFLRAAPAVGALLMSFWLARYTIQRRVGLVMFATVAGFGVATIVFGLSTSFWLSLAALVLLGAFDMVSMVIRHALVQLDTPDAMRGRVSAVNSVFVNTSNQLGEFESGFAAAWLGAVPATLLGGIGTLVIVAVWMGLFPTLRKRESLHQLPMLQPEPKETGTPGAEQGVEEEIAEKSEVL